MAKLFGKIRHLLQRSIFWKLFLIYAMTTLALVIVTTGTFRWAFNRDQAMKEVVGKNFVQYTGYLIEEIGTPPNHSRAKRLAEELNLQFRIESPQGMWASDESLPSLSALSVWATLPDPQSDHEAQVGRYRGHPFFILDRSNTKFVVFFLHPRFREVSATGIILLLGTIALILGGSYLLVRRLFRPIHWLKEGANEITKANFSHQVPVRSSDELGQLTDVFNEMARHVRNMIRARERLLLDVSHELRSPLTRMKVALELVEDDESKTKMQQEIQELETMITELLESERLASAYGGLTLREVDLVALIREIVEAYAEQEPGVRLISTPANALVKLDQDRAQMAVRNVVENAVKHSIPEHGPIDIRIQAEQKTASVSVQDHGLGIALEEQPRIFEPFYRIDKSRTRETGGYGLGLNLAKNIMVAHGGDILLTSQVGQGSTFTLTFPLVSEQTAEENPA